MAKPRVFISSTYYDLRHIRDRLEAFIEAFGYEPVLFESGDVPFRSDVPLGESCYAEVKLCHILVLIIGSRYGSATSDSPTPTSADADARYVFYNSITRKEYETARERDIPIFIFVEKAVLAEFQTFKKNKSTGANVTYAHVDNVNVFHLIDHILSRERNNFVRGFDRFDDISSWLREQWAGLFADFVSRRGAETNLRDLSARIAELGQVTSALKEYSEAIIRKIEPGSAKGIIDRQHRKISEGRVRAFGQEPMIQFLLREGRPMNAGASRTAQGLYRAFERSRDLGSFLRLAGFSEVFVGTFLTNYASAAQRDYLSIGARYFERTTGDVLKEKAKPSARGKAKVSGSVAKAARARKGR
jgi:hypothetical protein